MDRRLIVIIAVAVIELVLRLAYPLIHIEALVYTFLARAIEMCVIMAFAFDLCGIRAGSYKKEVLIGLGVAILFGASVFTADGIAGIFMERGLISNLLARRPAFGGAGKPAIFFCVACIFAPFVEELFFRGLVYAWIRKRLPIALAVLISSFLFASMHGHIHLVQLIGGIVFAVIFEWRDNIWPSYIIHVLANIGIWIFPFIYSLWMA
ncbi:MAG: type II CAAX endopeptidase family protein [Thermodesulfobacteriota bacterium]|nr:type II CAAX endopeptidase family protein [Thermodesulfobacteriota bacterium]